MSQKTPPHPVRSALRESAIILIAWVLCCCWVVGYCATFAFPSTDHDGGTAPLSTTLGFPTWVFWGIAAPWIVTNLFTIVFCFFILRDDDTAGDNDV